MEIEAPPPRRRALIGLAPLIDVVFILLVFFMLASSFLDWRLLPLHAASGEAPAAAEQTALRVHIAADGGIRLEGRAMEPDGLTRALSARLAEAPERSVVVQPEGDVPLQRLVAVLDRVRTAGASRVTLAEE
ncbi:MAG: ExbD/TolR family protein [Ectothiorhodospira sp.]